MARNESPVDTGGFGMLNKSSRYRLAKLGAHGSSRGVEPRENEIDDERSVDRLAWHVARRRPQGPQDESSSMTGVGANERGHLIGRVRTIDEA
jgi:hypothetical protein